MGLGLAGTLLFFFLLKSGSLFGRVLPWFGEYLVANETPVQADAVVVLAGDYYGNRIHTAAELVKQGFAPKVYVSGPGPFYGMNEGAMAVAFVVKEGYPAGWFRVVENHADSTLEEVGVLWPALERDQVRRLLVVTSTYHSKRSLRVWRRVAKAAEIHMIASPDKHFQASKWWETRPSRKIFLLEWVKTLADWLGI